MCWCFIHYYHKVPLNLSDSQTNERTVDHINVYVSSDSYTSNVQIVSMLLGALNYIL